MQLYAFANYSIMTKRPTTRQDAPQKKARSIFRERGGVLRTQMAIRAGVHPATLYAMRDDGTLEQLSRGLYRLANLPPPGQPDLLTVAMKVPAGVLCLISALAFHKLTTQVPHEVYLALPRGARRPKLTYPPIRVFWFIDSVFKEGIEQHRIEGKNIKVYSAEKTLADCFKYRNKIGLDTAVEALRLYQKRRKLRADLLLRHARVCRVERIMRPYLEALL